MEFNVNNYVRVRLTETGREKLRQWHKDLMGTMDGYREPKEDADGWSRWQMWSLMQQLGWALGNGITAPFETTIIIETPNVKVTGAPATVIKGEKNVKKLTRYAGLIAGASLLTAGLGGCANEDPQKPDQCMRREIFMQCMAALPAGPKATMYNDWAEVVGECDNAAHYQSLRRKSQIKPECQP